MTNINLMQAYELDKLSKLGLSDEEILQTVRTGDVSSWRSLVPNFEFNETLALYEEGEQNLLNALHGHYRIKYVTLPGIQRLLHLRFNLEETKNFMLEDTGITNLTCDEETLLKIKNMLSINWTIATQKDGTYRIFAK
ncbi:hypothetical protein ACIQXI_05700 [Lysinibacillus sp. NPDC097195]|uniref:hypothetical protein n=1 Tax=Lysinibacillus sp. NPDC097195 TaxID=3364141 RepID=UPI0038239AAD